MSDLVTALAFVKERGYVVLKEKSYRQAQERQRVAEVMRRYAEEDAERARAWARDHCEAERRLRDRLTFVYGIACAHGATVEELAGDQSARIDPTLAALEAEREREEAPLVDPHDQPEGATP